MKPIRFFATFSLLFLPSYTQAQATTEQWYMFKSGGIYRQNFFKDNAADEFYDSYRLSEVNPAGQMNDENNRSEIRLTLERSGNGSPTTSNYFGLESDSYNSTSTGGGDGYHFVRLNNFAFSLSGASQPKRFTTVVRVEDPGTTPAPKFIAGLDLQYNLAGRDLAVPPRNFAKCCAEIQKISGQYTLTKLWYSQSNATNNANYVDFQVVSRAKAVEIDTVNYLLLDFILTQNGNNCSIVADAYDGPNLDGIAEFPSNIEDSGFTKLGTASISTTQTPAIVVTTFFSMDKAASTTAGADQAVYALRITR